MTSLIKKMVTIPDNDEGQTVEEFWAERHAAYDVADRRIEEINRLMAEGMSQEDAFRQAVETIR